MLFIFLYCTVLLHLAHMHSLPWVLSQSEGNANAASKEWNKQIKKLAFSKLDEKGMGIWRVEGEGE